jgi:hypothetical protein
LLLFRPLTTKDGNLLQFFLLHVVGAITRHIICH